MLATKPMQVNGKEIQTSLKVSISPFLGELNVCALCCLLRIVVMFMFFVVCSRSPRPNCVHVRLLSHDYCVKTPQCFLFYIVSCCLQVYLLFHTVFLCSFLLSLWITFGFTKNFYSAQRYRLFVSLPCFVQYVTGKRDEGGVIR